jgi:1-acyl-sn-glycerol-3-phosphate acyltransferase
MVGHLAYHFRIGGWLFLEKIPLATKAPRHRVDKVIEKEVKDLFYDVFKWFMRAVLRVYFNHIRLEGLENVPVGKPFILAANHQNAFLDALIVGAFIPGRLHYLTRGDVFNWWSKPLLGLLNMMPIYRIRDGYGKLTANEAIFRACQTLFAQQKSVMIFPEANHGECHFLRPLSKGTSRLALESQELLNGPLYIVPCGLNFFAHRLPRTPLLVAFGKPIKVAGYLSGYKENKPKAINTLKEDLSIGMKACLAIPEDTPDYLLIARVVFKEENKNKSLDELRLLASVPAEKMPLKPGKNYLVPILFLSLFNALPLLILWWVLRFFEDKVFWGSMKLVVMIFLMPVWWIGLFMIGTYYLDLYAGLLLIVISVMTLFARAGLRKLEAL